MSHLVKNLKQPDNGLNAGLTHPAVKLRNVDADGFTCADVAGVAHDDCGPILRRLLQSTTILSRRLVRQLETAELTEFSAEQKKGGK